MFDEQKYSKIMKWTEKHQSKIKLIIKKQIFNHHKNEYEKLNISLNIRRKNKQSTLKIKAYDLKFYMFKINVDRINLI